MKQWREIPGWPGYRVSNDGVVQTKKSHGGTLAKDWLTKEPVADKDGYLRIRLTHKTRTVYTGVHDLVLVCFGTPRPPGNSMGLHANGIRNDNRIENLRWGFGDDNARDRDLHGTTAQFERNGNAKLSWEQVREIRRIRSTTGMSLCALALKFGMSKKCILNIIHNRTWDESKALRVI